MFKVWRGITVVHLLVLGTGTTKAIYGLYKKPFIIDKTRGRKVIYATESDYKALNVVQF